MRTNIEIDDDLMKEAMVASGSRTEGEAVERGLELLVALGHQASFRDLRGKLTWTGDLDEMRADRS